MRIAVMGAGGLGGYFGARLALGGAEVHFIARGRHLQALRAEGLRIVGPEPMHVARVNATDDARALGAVDLVMLCVKLWDTEAALEQIRPLVGRQSTVISFQNGVLKDQALRAAFGAAAVMGGVGYVAATIDSPGVIRQTGPMQRLLFGEFDGSPSARGQAFLQACLAGGIQAELSDDIEREIWQKFVFLAALSGATTTIRKPIGAIRGHAQTRGLLLDLMHEVVAVGRAHGVNLACGLRRTTLAPGRRCRAGHDFVDASRPRARQSAGSALAGRCRGRTRPRQRRAHAAQPRRRRYPGAARRRPYAMSAPAHRWPPAGPCPKGTPQ